MTSQWSYLMKTRSTVRGKKIGYGALVLFLSGCGSSALPTDPGHGGQGGGSGQAGVAAGGNGGAAGQGGSAGAATGGAGGSATGGAGGGTGVGGSGGGVCSPQQQQEGQTLRTSLLPEYHGHLTYGAGSMPATELTIQLADQGGNVSCTQLFANGGPIGDVIGFDVSVHFATQDGSFDEKFSATVTNRFALTFDYDLKAPQGTFDPGAGYTREVNLHADFQAASTTGIIWKTKTSTDCGCGGKPGCVCSNSSGDLIGGRW
jgi:hypothetical protein